MPLSAEAQLVLACTRWPLGERELQAIAQALTPALDWPLVHRLRERHRVSGLTAHALLAADGALPPHVRETCRADRQEAVARELRAAGEAWRLVQALRATGIAVRLLKGPAVSLLAFGRLGLRTNRDIDLLVAPDDRVAAVEIIGQAGFARVEPAADAAPDSVLRWFETRKDMVFARADGTMVELHWRLFDNPMLLPGLEGDSWSSVASGSMRFDTLGSEDNLVYLCTHGAQHAWSRLKWLADVAALFRQLPRDGFAPLLERARALRVHPAVGQALLLAKRHMMLVLPDEIDRRLAGDRQVRLLVWVGEQALFRGDGQEIEEQPFGTTLKNASHYLIATGWPYRREELRFDVLDTDAAGLPESYRRFGPFARVAGKLASLSGRRPGH